MIYKFANTLEEINQIHQLNFEIFVKELRQYPNNNQGYLIDRFHNENSYYICKLEQQVIGMIAFRDIRPFSLDYKITNLDQYLPKYKKIFEIRLLAIKTDFRKSSIMWRLIQGGIRDYLINDFDLAIISGITTQEKVYHKLGFCNFYDPIPGGEAYYIPMYITKEKFLELNWHYKN